MSIQQAFDKFIEKDVYFAIQLATVATKQETNIYVEFFDDGYSMYVPELPKGEVYTPSGLVLQISILTFNEWQEWVDDLNYKIFDRAIEKIKQDFTIALNTRKS